MRLERPVGRKSRRAEDAINIVVWIAPDLSRAVRSNVPYPAPPSSLADVAKGGDGAESAWILAPDFFFRSPLAERLVLRRRSRGVLLP
jgi:hypothetical protein